MSNFVYDGTPLNNTKADRTAIPFGEDPNKWVQAVADWNPAMNASLDLRGSVINNRFFGLQQLAAEPAVPTGAAPDFLWLDTLGNLWAKVNGVSTNLLAGGGGGTLITSYNLGTAAADQTLLIQAVKGGEVNFKANGAATGVLLKSQTSAAVDLFSIADNAQAYLAGNAPDSGANNGVVLDAKTALTAGRHYFEARNGGVAQWGMYSDASAIQTLEVLAGTQSQIFGNGNIVVADNSVKNNFLQINSAGLIALITNGNAEVLSTQADGAGAVGLFVDSQSPWVNPAARLQYWSNNGTSKMSIYASGALRLHTSSAAAIAGAFRWNGTFVQFSNDGATWVNIPTSGSSTTLSAAYAAGSSQTDSTITLDSTRLGVVVKDSVGGIAGDLFAVQNGVTGVLLAVSETSIRANILLSPLTDASAALGSSSVRWGGFFSRTGTFGLPASNNTSWDTSGFQRSKSDNIGTNQSLGQLPLIVHNTQPALLGSQQYSPFIVWDGKGFATTPAVSQDVAMGLQVRVIQGALNPTSEMVLWSSVGGSAFAEVLAITQSGTLRTPSTAILLSSIANAGTNVGVATDTANALTTGRSYFEVRTGGATQWAYQTNSGHAEIVGLTAQHVVAGAGQISIQDKATNNSPSTYLIVDANMTLQVTTGGFSLTTYNAAGTISFTSGQPNSAVTALTVDTTNTWTDAGAKLQTWATGGVEKFATMANGQPRWSAAANVQTTVGAAGGASALPATPDKYLKVQDSTGTTYVIPAYNP